MSNDSMIAKAVDKLIEKPFFLGDLTGVKGYDCLNTIKSFYTELGVILPDEFEGVTWDSYAAKWDDDPEEAREVLIRFLRSLGKPVGINYCLRGDLLIIESRNEKKYSEGIIKRMLDTIGKKFPKMVKETRKFLEGKKLLIFPAIYVGNSKILMVITTDRDEKGPRILPLRFFKRNVTEVRRLINA